MNPGSFRLQDVEFFVFLIVAEPVSLGSKKGRLFFGVGNIVTLKVTSNGEGRE
jgi:hypothetical protein